MRHWTTWAGHKVRLRYEVQRLTGEVRDGLRVMECVAEYPNKRDAIRAARKIPDSCVLKASDDGGLMVFDNGGWRI